MVVAAKACSRGTALYVHTFPAQLLMASCACLSLSSLSIMVAVVRTAHSVSK